MMKVKYCACLFTDETIMMCLSENTLKRRVREYLRYNPGVKVKRFFKHIEEARKTAF